MKNELYDILKTHVQKYPLLQKEDVLKLIYQNEFGGGHLVKDPAFSLNYLKKEYSETNHEIPVENEYIGNHIVRYYLNNLKEEKLETLNRAFVESSASHQGSIESFEEKVHFVLQHFGEFGFSFELKDLMEKLQELKDANYPAISHSVVYHNRYLPAYRVILDDYLDELK